MNLSWKNTASQRARDLVFTSILFVLLFLTGGNNAIAQQADFTVNVTSGCLPLTVDFTDASTGTITSRTWDFGNGNPSTLKDPQATYTTAGTYTVTLTVFNGVQSNTKTKTGLIIVHDFPVVDFSFDTNSGCAPLGVKFTDKTNASAGALTNWLWVFGDGGTSTVANPSYSYAQPGNVAVSLKVKNQHGCERTKIVASAIDVLGPKVLFSPSSTTGCDLPATIQFTDQSTGQGPLSYSWDFKDGSTSTEQSPTHSFTKAGSFSVKQKVRDVNGCEATHAVTINAGSEGGMDFTPSAIKICLGQKLTFNVQANSTITSYDWDFGNQTHSADQNPFTSYTALGTYAITLKAKLRNNTCFSFVTKNIEVVAAPTPAFTYSVDCSYNITLNNTSTGAARLEWFINNTLQSTKESFSRSLGFAGEYTIKLIAYNSSNCSEELERKITLTGNIEAKFLPEVEQDCSLLSLSGCAPFSLQFTNKSVSSTPFTSLWEFGDGNTSTEQNPLHVYGKGNFTVKLTIRSEQGCTNFITAKVTVSDSKPVSKFTVDKTSACAGEEVRFSSQSENTTFWCWDFGDGTVGTDAQVVHKYIRPGVYTVKLISKNAGCSDTFTIVNAIEIKNPYVNFNISKSCNSPFKISLKNISENYNSLQWNFGDGNTSNTDVTEHTYQSTGHYNVELTASNPTTLCTTKVTIPVFIQEIKADFEIDNPTPCRNAPVKFIDKSSSATQWQWSLGNNFFSTDQNTSTAYTNVGNFQASLTVFDADGCSARKSLPVKVLSPEGKFDFNATSNCEAFTVQFKDQSQTTTAVTARNWDFGDGETSSDSNPQHSYHSPGKYDVTLTLTTSEGTCSFIKDNVIDFTLPVADFAFPKPTFCINETFALTNHSIRAVSFDWSLGNGRSSNDPSPSISYPSIGSYPVTLSVTDKYGCKLSVTNYAVIAKPTAVFDVAEQNGTCPPFTSFFKDKSVGKIKDWQWDFGDGHGSALSNPANTYLEAGDFDVKLKVTDEGGCTDEILTSDFIRVGGPSGTFISDASGSFCTNKTVSFQAQTKNTATHRWDFGDGTVQDVSKTGASHHYNQKGKFTVGLVLIDGNGCKVALDKKINITINDTTKIEMDPFPACLFGGDKFNGSARAINNEDMTWNWNIDGTIVGSTDVIETAVEKGGQHQLTLTATNRFGCSSHLYSQFSIQDYLLFIPNVITPNKDGYNESFEIEGLKNGDWNIMIYNRWGNLVFQENHYQGGWSGNPQDPGVYYYSIQNGLCEDKKYKGPVSVIH